MDRRAFIENLSKGIVGSAAAYRLTQGFPAVAGAAATQLDPVVETTAGKIQRFLMIKEGGGSDESESYRVSRRPNSLNQATSACS